jgi:hypothetical protein
MRADKPSRQMINLFGAWHDTNVMFKLANTVEVIPGDRIVDEHGEIYLIEGPVNHLQKGIYTIMQNVRAKTLSKADPIYTYDISEELGGDPLPAVGGQQFGVFNGSSSLVNIDDNDRLSLVSKDHAVFSQATSRIDVTDDDLLTFSEDKFAEFNGSSSVITVADDDVLSFAELNHASFVDGSSQIDVTDDDSLTFVSGGVDQPFSISLWLYATDTGNNMLVGKGNGEYHLMIGSTPGVYFRLDDETNGGFMSSTSSDLVPYDEWVHITATYDGSALPTGLKTYINSVETAYDEQVESGVYSGMENLTDGLRLGRGWGIFGTLGLMLGGLLRDVKIFSEELSQAAIDQEYTSGDYTTNVVANWPLAGDSLDVGPNGLHGVDTNITYGWEDTPFTIMAWIYKFATSDLHIMSKLSVSDAEYYFYVDSGTPYLTMILYDTSNFARNIRRQTSGGTPGEIQNGKWYHLAATYDGTGLASGIQLYINGSMPDLIAETNGPYIGMANKIEPLEIGTDSFGNYSNACMRDVKIFGREFTEAEILDEYNNNSATTDLIAHWPLAGTDVDIGPNSLSGISTDLTYLGDSSFSISFWVNVADYGTFGYTLMQKGDQEYRIMSNANGTITFNITDDDTNWDLNRGSVLATPLSNDPDVWNHVVVTYDGGEKINKAEGMTLYIDGVDVSGAPVTDAGYLVMRNTTDGFAFGGGHGTYDNALFKFYGNLKHIKLFDAELTPTEVLNEMILVEII